MTERYNNYNINGVNPTTLKGISETVGNLFITGGSLKATFNSNTIGSCLYTTGGNVGINVIPGYQFQVGGTIRASNCMVQPNLPSFRMYLNGSYTNFIYGYAIYNNGFVAGTYYVRIPYAGFYLIQLQMTNNSGYTGAWAAVCVNTTSAATGNLVVQPQLYCQETTCAVYQLNAGDYLYPYVQGGTLYGDGNSSFGVTLLSRSN